MTAPDSNAPDTAPESSHGGPNASSDPKLEEQFKRELIALIPHLRAFARTLAGDPAGADDLAQDAMMKAWDARASYQMGTNMKAWTFMILRNQFYSEKRRSWRQTQLDQLPFERGVVGGGPLRADAVGGLAHSPPPALRSSAFRRMSRNSSGTSSLTTSSNI